MIDVHNSTKWAVRVAYCENPEADTIHHDNGSIVVMKGLPRVLLNTGESVEI